MFADMCAAYDAFSPEMKARLAGLVGLHGRSSGPAGERLYGDDKGMTDKKYSRQRRAGGRQSSGQRAPDPVRQPDAHARF